MKCKCVSLVFMLLILGCCSSVALATVSGYELSVEWWEGIVTTGRQITGVIRNLQNQAYQQGKATGTDPNAIFADSMRKAYPGSDPQKGVIIYGDVVCVYDGGTSEILTAQVKKDDIVESFDLVNKQVTFANGGDRVVLNLSPFPYFFQVTGRLIDLRSADVYALRKIKDNNVKYRDQIVSVTDPGAIIMNDAFSFVINKHGNRSMAQLAEEFVSNPVIQENVFDTAKAIYSSGPVTAKNMQEGDVKSNSEKKSNLLNMANNLAETILFGGLLSAVFIMVIVVHYRKLEKQVGASVPKTGHSLWYKAGRYIHMIAENKKCATMRS